MKRKNKTKFCTKYLFILTIILSHYLKNEPFKLLTGNRSVGFAKGSKTNVEVVYENEI